MGINFGRLTSQINFLLQLDELKKVSRQNKLLDGSRFENVAEHSWNAAIVAMVLEEYLSQTVDMYKTVKMILLHDLIETIAGDTYAFSTEEKEKIYKREVSAAKSVFSILPKKQSEEFFGLWKEYSEMVSDESIFANAIDRIQPFINEYFSISNEHPPTSQMKERMLIAKKCLPELWEIIEKIIDINDK